VKNLLDYNIVILGILFSLIFAEITGVSPGGMIVPGYMALYYNLPHRIAATVGLSLITFLIGRILFNHTILFGRRKFAVMILISFTCSYLLSWIVGYAGFIYHPVVLVIGYLVPGILALEMDRQGVIKTVAAMLIVTSILKLVALLWSR